jgi:hypothetical protein
MRFYCVFLSIKMQNYCKVWPKYNKNIRNTNQIIPKFAFDISFSASFRILAPDNGKTLKLERAFYLFLMEHDRRCLFIAFCKNHLFFNTSIT